MNIAAVYAALEVTDLDRSAKQALVCVCIRANHRSGVAVVSTGRIARDMGCHWNTAAAALARAVKKGYLTVDNSPGRVPLWHLTSPTIGGVDSLPPQPQEGYPHNPAVEPPQPLGRTPTTVRWGKIDRYKKDRDGDNAEASPSLVENLELDGSRSRHPSNGVAHAPGTGRLPNWSRGEE